MSTLIPLGQLHHHPDNPPERHADVAELADSIRAVGVLQALLVEPDGSSYVVVAGNRRFAAAKVAGLTEVPCTVRPAHDQDAHTAVRLIENGHRKNLTPLEQARAFGQLRDSGLSQTEIARRTGFSLGHVSNRLALLDLGAATQARIEAGTLRPDEALAAIRATRPDQRPKGRRQIPNDTTPLAKDHFGRGHGLANQAGARCRRTHGQLLAMGGLGGVACGRCWEATIRSHERQAVQGGAA